MTRTAVVICPGRGTYNKSELGVLRRHHSDAAEHLARFDARRAALGQATLTALDNAPQYSAAVHTRGENASALIYAASLLDARKIHDAFDIVGVTGNSIGWYSAMAVGGAMTGDAAFELVNTMGALMQKRLIGGQSVYPFVDENWRQVPGLQDSLLARVSEIDARPDHTLAVSIHLGGMLVVAGNDAGLDAFEVGLPRVQDRYPLRLTNHAAFHTSLQAPVSAEGRAALPEALFDTPKVPLVDGRGLVWAPLSCTAADLRGYTLGSQVVTPHDFTKAVQVAAKTFAPDTFIITGPGTTLGGAVAQALIDINWTSLTSKADFLSRQKSDPLILSMGRPDDRVRVIAPDA